MEKNNKTKVIIIGAGIAGLSCASTLIQNEKFDVTVLEARNRLGGRIDTKQFGPAVVDLGASWLHGISDNLLYNRGEEIGLKFRMTPEECEKLLQETDFNNIKFLPTPPVIDYHGKSMSQLYTQFYHEWEEVSDEVEDFYEDNKDEHGLVSDKIKDMSVMDKMREIAKKAGVDEKLKKKLGEDTYERLVQFSAQFQSGYYGGEMTSLSAKYMGFLHETGGDMLVLNGYMTAINYLAKGIDIKTNCQVSKISYDKKDAKHGSHSVTLETSLGTMTCDHVVVTVPLGCLKHNTVQFEPALPEGKQKAIDRLGAGLLDKVVLRFKKRFWEKDLRWLQVVPDGIGFTSFMNFFKQTLEPILVAFVSPEHGKIMETKEDSVVINEALSILKAYYGKKVGDLFEEGCVTKWWTDPFSQGSYSYLPVGSTPEDYTAMSEPICDDHVLFAGEHTTRSHPATVGGAYLSGQREAKRLLEKYNGGAKIEKKN